MKNKKVIVDSKEQVISKALENGEYTSVKNEASEIAKIREATMLGSTKSVSIRLVESDLNDIREKAKEKGMPYQTLIKTVLHQFAKGKFSVKL